MIDIIIGDQHLLSPFVTRDGIELKASMCNAAMSRSSVS
jgi:hypothetical protein